MKRIFDTDERYYASLENNCVAEVALVSDNDHIVATLALNIMLTHVTTYVKLAAFVAELKILKLVS